MGTNSESLVAVLSLLAVVDASVIIYTDAIPHTIAEEYRDLPALFGPELPTDGLRGLVVPGEPSNGCTKLQPPPTGVDNFTGKWIVIVARYNCSFDTKVRNAQEAGYDCAIVHNVNSSELESMKSENGTDINIPSVFVGDFAGLMLTEEYNYNSSYYVLVNSDVPFNINTQLILPFAVVVAICLIIILIIWLMKCINDRRRARRHRLSSRAVHKIPTCKYSKGDPYDTCAICLDDYQPGDTLRVLPCAHAYHSKCIDPWLTRSRRVCPVCKRRVVVSGEPAPPPDDSDTEPLLDDQPTQYLTDSGTFVQQRQNPTSAWVRRVRQIIVDIERHRMNIGNEENGASASSTSEEVERAPRRGRRSRRSRRRARSAAPSVAPPAPSVAPPASTVAPPAPSVAPPHADQQHPAPHTTGEIGVAALPATSDPPHLITFEH